ncbi:MAG: hypothetical protein ACI9E1_001832 [Cryomorphaceae bacterium]
MYTPANLFDAFGACGTLIGHWSLVIGHWFCLMQRNNHSKLSNGSAAAKNKTNDHLKTA